MTPLSYIKAADAAAAVRLGIGTGARYLGAGTNLVDLMRETIERPQILVDVSGLSKTIEELPDGGLLIGAAATNTAVAENAVVRTRFPLLSRAILAGASAQIRNMATVAGNLLQRTRCAYFYDVEGSRCNKRVPGQGCDARGGFNRNHAILGASQSCVTVHSSDMAVALVALEAVAHVVGAEGRRRISVADLYRLPEDHPETETTLAPGELITAIEIPPQSVAGNSTYRKVRDRASYAFALVSVAAALKVEAGRIAAVRVAFGGVAPKPWRAHAAESLLSGQSPTESLYAAAADAELASSHVLEHNAFKPALLKATLIAVLTSLHAEGAVA